MARLLRLRPPAPPRVERIHAPHQARALRASAAVVDPANRRDASSLIRYRQPWQHRAWELLDLVGEFRYVVKIHANSAQKVDTYPAIYVPGESEPVPIEDSDAARYAAAAHEALDRLGGVDTRRDLARRITENFQSVGEAFLIGRTDNGDGTPREVWEVRSTSEVDVTRDGKVILRDAPSAGPVRPWDSGAYELQPDDVIARMWVPHPRYRMQADSTARSALEILEELVLLTKEVHAEATSRIASRGLFVLPDSWMIQRADGIAATSAEDDPLLATLIEVGTEAIKEPGSAAAAFPVIMRSPADSTDKGEYYEFRSGDDRSAAKRAEALGRYATMANLPREVLTGVATGNHWCADADTDVLTQHGWLGHHLLEPGVAVLTLNSQTGESEWQPVERIYRAEVVDEQMLRLRTEAHDSLTTLDHRWPVIGADGKPAIHLSRDLAAGDYLLDAVVELDLAAPPGEPALRVNTVPWEWSEHAAAVVSYTGVVWCPTTANGTWLARRDGQAFYTGNSSWLVDDQRWRDHLEPGYRDVVDGLTGAYYRDHLAEAGVPPEIVARSVIWFDPAGAIVKSDRSEAAGAAYDRYELSGEAYRRYAGFGDDEAPTEDERLSRAALGGLLDPASALAVLQGRDPADVAVTGEPIAPQPDAPAELPAEGPPNGGVPIEPDAAAGMRRIIAARSRPALAIEPPAPVVAAAPPTMHRATLISRRLATIDTQLREQIRMAAEAAVRRVLEKFGARLIPKVRSNAAASAAIRDVPHWAVPYRLGPAMVAAALGLDEHQTLEAEFAALALLWDRYVDEAQTRTLSEAAALVGIEAAVALGQLGTTLRADREAAWRWLASALTARVWDAMGRDIAAEVTAAQLVPPGTIRAALALAGGFAGGTSAGLRDDGRPVDPSETFGQLGTGRTVRNFLTDNGAELVTYEWVHGFPSNPFRPHEELDGVQFTSEAEVDGNYPGDHGGCTCETLILWAPPDVAAEAD